MLKSDPAALRTTASLEYGASAALLRLAKDIGLDKALYSRPHEPWVRDCLAMIVGRLIYQGSKLALSQVTDFSALWSLCGTEGPIDVNEHCYAPMDRLLERQHAIEKNLTARHLTNGTLILYDITSSYFEGEYAESEIVKFGYNRDHKSGHEQMVIGLVTTAEGCPVCVEVFPGNTQDASTVIDKIRELRVRHGIEDFVFVGDRGMITASNEAKLGVLPAGDGIKIISALTHLEIVQMLECTGHAPELFDQNRIVEITDPVAPSRRYCLCRNPLTAARETTTRRELLERTRTELERIAATALKSRGTKRPASDELVGARVGTALAKTRMGKYVNPMAPHRAPRPTARRAARRTQGRHHGTGGAALDPHQHPRNPRRPAPRDRYSLRHLLPSPHRSYPRPGPPAPTHPNAPAPSGNPPANRPVATATKSETRCNPGGI